MNNLQITINWGNATGQSRSAIRQIIRTVLLQQHQLPCWREKKAGKYLLPGRLFTNPTNITINGRKVHVFKNEMDILNPEMLLHKIKKLPAVNTSKAIKQTIRHVVTAMLIALFPKCPVCWGIYLSLFSSVGIAKIPYTPEMLLLFLLIMVYNIYQMYHTCFIRKYFIPWYIQLTAYLALLINWRYMNNDWIIGLSITGLVLSSLLINTRLSIHHLLKSIKHGLH
ncbi:hypothetical protein [Chitinophaga nivalis]|uniref:MerC domain-containing protein n=1 Tax=Chitinophaga nivalis TaxID=2991709 RepID=A0ABT3IN06_9BACT|nr:hypothetical protein [Chitinophaga nivalis]MCW3464969.1 hypothetical protein [Chitinophaga nivalis]MCW3485339.1 hypothetical protein [Chitinophaga nivalis]